jgi:hypothetical protein
MLYVNYDIKSQAFREHQQIISGVLLNVLGRVSNIPISIPAWICRVYFQIGRLECLHSHAEKGEPSSSSLAAYSVMNGKFASISNANPSQSLPSAGNPNHNDYRCAGKTHCLEMSSCDQTRFYLENCLSVEIDGYRDGVPCVRQLCDW